MQRVLLIDLLDIGEPEWLQQKQLHKHWFGHHRSEKKKKPYTVSTKQVRGNVDLYWRYIIQWWKKHFEEPNEHVSPSGGSAKNLWCFGVHLYGLGYSGNTSWQQGFSSVWDLARDVEGSQQGLGCVFNMTNQCFLGI